MNQIMSVILIGTIVAANSVSASVMSFKVTGKAQFHPWNGPGENIEEAAERDAERMAHAEGLCHSPPYRISEFVYSYVPYGTVTATATYQCSFQW